MRCALLSLLLLVAGPSLAQDSPIARIEVEPLEIAVGEPVIVRITALCPTFLPKPPGFPTAELANAVTRLPPRSGTSISERVDGETWSGVQRRYEIYPLMGATYRLGDQSVAVTCAEPGTIKGTTVDLPLEEIIFKAVVPAGAESVVPYVAGSSLELEQSVEGETDSLEAGDAVVVSYVAELDGLPAIFLPPLVEIEETPGVSVYPDQPVVEDSQPALRTERYTFVFEAGGDFVIPGATLDWWNRDAGRIETSAVEPMTVSVVGDPLPVPEEEPPPAEPIDWRGVAIGVVLLYLVWKLASRLAPRLQAAWSASRRRRLESEEHAFGRLERVLLGRDRRQAQAALVVWLERIAPGFTLGEFAERYGDDRLRRELQEMSQTLYRDSSHDIPMKRLLIPLTKARRRVKSERQRNAEPALPPLNP